MKSLWDVALLRPDDSVWTIVECVPASCERDALKGAGEKLVLRRNASDIVLAVGRELAEHCRTFSQFYFGGCMDTYAAYQTRAVIRFSA